MARNNKHNIRDISQRYCLREALEELLLIADTIREELEQAPGTSKELIEKELTDIMVDAMDKNQLFKIDYFIEVQGILDVVLSSWNNEPILKQALNQREKLLIDGGKNEN